MKIIKEDLWNKLSNKINRINTDRQNWLADNYGSNLSLDGRDMVLDTSTMKYKIERNIYSPILKRFFNSVKNIVTSNEYKWLLKDTGVSETYTDNDKLTAQAILDYAYEKNKFNVLDDIIITYVLRYFFALIYVGWENGDATINIINPMNVFIEENNKTTSGIYNGESIIFFDETTKEEVKNKYDIDFNKVEYKTMYDTLGTTSNDAEDIRYMYYFYRESGKIKGFKSVGTYILEEYDDLDMFPISIIKAQEEDYNVYGTSLSTMIAPIGDKLQKAYEVINKHLEGYGKRMILQKRGGVLSVRGLSDSISKLTNMDGIIEYTGDTPQTYQPPQIDNSFTYMQQILDVAMQNSVGVHNASLGTVEGRSGIQMAQAQQGDKQNIVDMVQNYKEGIVGLTKIILYFYSKYLNVDKILSYEGVNLRVIGKEEYNFLEKIGVDTSSLMPIQYFDRLDVEIVPGDFFTQTYLTNKLIELKGMGLPIPDEVLMESIKVGDVGLLLRKYNLLQEQHNSEDPDMLIAIAENKKLGQGGNVSVDINDNHKEHIMIHNEMLNKLKAQKINETLQYLQQQGIEITEEEVQQAQQGAEQDKVVQLFTQHIEEHNTFLQGEQQNLSTNGL